MKMRKAADRDNMTMVVEGRLDAITSEAFGAEAADVPAGVKCLIFDFARLEFISSAGLRVIVNAYKLMAGRGGSVKVANANETVRDVLKLTGLAAVLGVS